MGSQSSKQPPKPRAEILNESQRACLEVSGNCASCRQNPERLGLESVTECKVKFSPGVAPKLGLKVHRNLASQKKQYPPSVCHVCAKRIMRKSAGFCPACRKEVEARGRLCLTCGKCGKAFIEPPATEKPRHCVPCR